MARFRLLVGLCVFFVSVAGAAERQETRSAAAVENEADESPVGRLGRWNVEKTREIARVFKELPEPVALKALWLAASAPNGVDVTTVFVNASTSEYPSVRRHTADLLISFDTPDSNRLLMTSLSSEKDPDVIRHVVDGLASLPTKQAVRRMIDIMYDTGIDPAAVETAAGHLRRLTRAELSDRPGDWQSWWLDNQQFFD